MVPVELRLSNFLSYGKAPQALDFSQFHVACLSGKNGQGKSALLDAITWVLWGEARKSSGGHKPDEELLRIGSRRMSVELLFDVEEIRYRVLRSYSRSATGKTSKSELEIQVLDADATEGRPITRSSIRESQEYLNEILGLDYHTFINSAFLLQGRSDEFTKKKPSERKDILGRILNLEKYDRLAGMARLRQRELNDALDVLKREVERLVLALEPEKEWQKAFSETQAALALKKTELEDARTIEAGLVEQLGAFEAQAKTAASILESLSRIDADVKSHEEEQAKLNSKIATANDLVLKKDQIEKQVEELNGLIEERELLDSSREVYRGIEQQILQKKNELQAYRNDIEQKIRQFELELKMSRDAINEIEAKLEQRNKYEEDLAEAKAAKTRVLQMQEKLSIRDQLKAEISVLNNVINGKRESLVGQIKSLEEQERLVSVPAHRKTELLTEKQVHETNVQKLALIKGKLEQVTQEGLELAERIKTCEGESAVLSREKKRVEAQFEAINEVSRSECPTCGSTLTTDHRKEVADQLRAQLAQLDEQLKSNETKIAEDTEKRNGLRETYLSIQNEADQMSASSEKVVLLGEQLKAIDLQEKEQQQITEKISVLKKQIDEKLFAAEEEEKRSNLEIQLSKLALPEKELEEDRFKANQIVRFEEHLRSILMAEGRKETFVAKIESHTLQIEQARKKIDTGDKVDVLKKDIADKEEQLAGVGFDPARFEAVRKRIKELAHAQNQFKDLLNARQNLTDWEAQRDKIKTRISQFIEEQSLLKEKHKEIAHVLAGKEALEKQLQEAKSSCESIEGASQTLQIQSGELQARLAQAGENKEALKKSRRSIKDLKGEEGLYAKLKRAFGKHGIPSLIIEQSLPEIEARTNELLSKLTEGKMRVTLETLKDKKSGGTRETLEIIITDEQGAPRPYETFSGGEAFRVNFALRIALSQMLAERNGVKIRTLGIDEGFGTQDQEGIQNLIEALQVIQEDFDKILVITHLDRLKEVFPVRIEVEKDPVDGSRFTLIKS